MSSNFDEDFMNLFNPYKSKEARKNFRCRLCDLYLNYPEYFHKGYYNAEKGKYDRLGISLTVEGMNHIEEAKNILHNVYIPELNVSRYNITSKYTTKSGEVRTYNYTSTYVSQKKTNISDTLKDVLNTDEAKNILNENNGIYMKAAEIYHLPNFPKNITLTQLKQYLYRNFK